MSTVTDQLETILAFPTHIYVIEKPEFLAAVRPVAMEHLTQQAKEQGDLDEIYPVRMTGTLHEDPRIEEFAAYVAVSAGRILADQGYAMPGRATYFESMWCQEHHKHSAMDQHVHPGVQIVGFYFVDVPAGSSAATFHDPRAGKVQGGMPETNMREVTYASNAFHFGPQPGTLLFTNAWLAHSFTRHAAATPIRFLHFNIGVVEATPEPAEVI